MLIFVGIPIEATKSTFLPDCNCKTKLPFFKYSNCYYCISPTYINPSSKSPAISLGSSARTCWSGLFLLACPSGHHTILTSERGRCDL